jgi:hypothetical protein
MGAIWTENATPEKQKGRQTLSVRDPLVESLVVGLGIEGEHLEQLRRFCKRLTSERNRWDVSRRAGLFGSRPLKKDEAEQALRRALQSMVGGSA